MGNGAVRSEPAEIRGAAASADAAVGRAANGDLDEIERLLRAGLAEIVQRGSVEPRVVDIVRRAGLSNKAFYRHFASKDELVAAILDRVMRDRVREFDERLATATSAVERVRLWVWTVLEQAMVPALADATRPLLVYQARLADELGPQLWGHRDHLRAPLRAALEEGVRSGELVDVDPERDSEVITYLALGWMHGRVIARSVPTRDEARRVVEFAVRGLLGARS